MATTVVHSIGTSSRDYSTLQAWEDSAPANLVTADQIWRGECYNDTEFTGATTMLTVAGSTSDSTRYKELTAAAGESFADNANKLTNALRYNQANGVAITQSGGYVFTVLATENYFRLSNLQIKSTGVAASSTGATNISGTGTVQDACILYGKGTPAATAISDGILKNSLIVVPSGAAVSVGGVSVAGNANVYGCTVVRFDNNGSRAGIALDYSSATTVRNCAVFGFPNDLTNANSSGSTTTTCASDDTSPHSGFTGSIPFSTATFVNVTSGSEDFRLVTGSALIGVGTTDATNTPNDIVGTARS
jgi:hypothetical protein